MDVEAKLNMGEILISSAFTHRRPSLLQSALVSRQFTIWGLVARRGSFLARYGDFAAHSRDFLVRSAIR
jgi:hypothetical protein